MAVEVTGQDKVKDVHNLHNWAMSTTGNALSVHLIVDKEDFGNLLKHLKHKLREKFDIVHTTIQLEGARLHDSLKTE